MYGSLNRLKTDHLKQLLETTEHDGALTRCLDDATAIIDLELGYAFAASAASGTRVLYGDGSTMLRLPPDASTVTLVTAPSGYTVPTWAEIDGYLVVVDEYGVQVGSRWPSSLTYDAYWPDVWAPGVPYTVSATYGGIPLPIARLTCELATQLWRFREAGGSDTVGTESAVYQVRAGLTAFQRAILDRYRNVGVTAGVY
jgi:hypothetical protein